MLEEVVVNWQQVRWMWQMRQNFVAQFVQLLKHWLCEMWLCIVEKNWALSVDQCWLQALQFLVHLINLLSIILRHNGFTGIQKVVLDNTSSRLPNSDHDIFWCKFGSGKCFWASYMHKIKISHHMYLNESVKVKVTQSCAKSLRPHGIVHKILQVRVLEWVAVPFSSGSSRPRDLTQVSLVAGELFISWATREA